MHDPLVVAFEIRRPWPERASPSPNPVRWPLWSPFWCVAGRGLYWPPLVTVWHHEPGGRDSGEVCRHIVRYRDDHGEWRVKIRHGWRAHVHHWRIQIHPLQVLRRRLLTRCAHCGGRSTKTNQVNVAAGWYTRETPWWCGEAELYHRDCR